MKNAIIAIYLIFILALVIVAVGLIGEEDYNAKAREMMMCEKMVRAGAWPAEACNP